MSSIVILMPNNYEDTFNNLTKVQVLRSFLKSISDNISIWSYNNEFSCEYTRLIKDANRNHDALIFVIDHPKSSLYFYKLGFSACISFNNSGKPILFFCEDSIEKKFCFHNGLLLGFDELQHEELQLAVVSYLKKDRDSFWSSYSKYVVDKYNRHYQVKLVKREYSEVKEYFMNEDPGYWFKHRL